MKKLTNAISALAAVFLLLAGCTDKDSVTYSGREAGRSLAEDAYLSLFWQKSIPDLVRSLRRRLPF